MRAETWSTTALNTRFPCSVIIVSQLAAGCRPTVAVVRGRSPQALGAPESTPPEARYEERSMKPEEALRQIKTLIEGSDYVTDPRAMLTLIESIRVLVEKGLEPGGRPG